MSATTRSKREKGRLEAAPFFVKVLFSSCGCYDAKAKRGKPGNKDNCMSRSRITVAVFASLQFSAAHGEPIDKTLPAIDALRECSADIKNQKIHLGNKLCARMKYSSIMRDAVRPVGGSTVKTCRIGKDIIVRIIDHELKSSITVNLTAKATPDVRCKQIKYI